MILKGSQRSVARQLAQHLLRADENKHVEVHEVRGFLSEDLQGALQPSIWTKAVLETVDGGSTWSI